MLFIVILRVIAIPHFFIALISKYQTALVLSLQCAEKSIVVAEKHLFQLEFGLILLGNIRLIVTPFTAGHVIVVILGANGLARLVDQARRGIAGLLAGLFLDGRFGHWGLIHLLLVGIPSKVQTVGSSL